MVRQGKLNEALVGGRVNRAYRPTTSSTTCVSSITSRWRDVLIAHYRNDRDEESIRDALRLLERLRHAAEDGGRTGSMIEILMLQALAQHAQGDISPGARLAGTRSDAG